MEAVVSELISQWGTFGVIIILTGFIIFDYFKRNKKHDYKEIEHQGSCLKGDIVLEGLKDLKDSMHIKFDGVTTSMDALEVKMNCFNEKIENKINDLEQRVKDIPKKNLEKMNADAHHKSLAHSKQFEDVLKLGPKLHDILDEYIQKINCTHIFIGSFHNGAESVAGIPYYKFDLIVERFNNQEQVKEDHEFAPVYKDADLLRYGKLPLALIQNKTLHFVVNENNESNMFEYDDIIIRRMIGMGIKQLVLQLLIDSKNKPSGFLGCVKYNYDDIDINELQRCSKELEHIYHTMENK